MPSDAKVNQHAWEEAYAHKNDYEQDLLKHIQSKTLYCLAEPLKDAIDDLKLEAGMHVMQFCANNGRELLDVCHAFQCRGTGFDLARNMVEAANQFAETLGVPVTFHAGDLLEQDMSVHDAADMVMMTVGSLCWFKSLDALFAQAASALKDDGILLVHDSHPFTYSTLAAASESNYDPECPERPVNDYGRTEPWVEGGGMGYMSTMKDSATFISYSHTMAELLNALSRHHLVLESFTESSVDYAGVFSEVTTVKLPYSMLLKARKKKL
ncbi:MAG: class I SAM-dependent methyltransferase [Acholeplasmatales bacterium]|nr:MAG: class I SAM-dependent methyltransferase [Acholeplasmatales bacterium]